MDLASGECRLEDVRGIERPLGRTRSDKGVQLVDVDDGVLILHQLLHDRLEPLLKLAAVLGAGHDQGKVERQNALLGQERQNHATGDALRETFHDGGLADARLAD